MSDCQLTRHEILNVINSWSVDEVVALLQKHELAECCDTIVKRNIDGDELLNLTEKKLELWIIDLGRPLLRHLWQFVNNLQNNPEAYYYVAINRVESRTPEDTLSNGSWDTEFEDDGEDLAISEETVRNNKSQWNSESAAENDRTEVDAEAKEDEEENECVYANQLEIFPCGMKTDIFKQTADNSDVNRLANELRQKLELRQPARPEIPPKPNIVPKKIVVSNNHVANGGNAVLSSDQCYGNANQSENVKPHLRPSVNLIHPAIINPIPSVPSATLSPPAKMKRPILPKPPSIAKPIGITKPLEPRLRNTETTKAVEMKLVGRANSNEVTGSIGIAMPVTGPRNDLLKSFTLPKQPNCAKSLDHANQRNSPPKSNTIDLAGPTQSIETKSALVNPINNPVNNLTTKPFGKSKALAERESNLPKPPMSGWLTLPKVAKENLIHDLREEWGLRHEKSISRNSITPIIDPSTADEEDDYEAVPEMEENATPQRVHLGLHTIPKMGKPPPPLPSKPPNMSAMHLSSQERSPEKPSLPLGSQTLPGRLSARPLPLPPERKTDVESWTDKPWYHDVNRAQANALLSRGLTESDSGPLNGQFLLRPSATNPNSPLTLVVWYDHRTYNISIRKRADNRWALGFNKSVEHSFVRIEDIVNFYKTAALVIYSGGQVIGNTRLTVTPPKPQIDRY